MRITNKYILIVFIVLSISKLYAQENLDSLLNIAAKNNAGLKASYNKYLADMQKVPQVGSLPDPDVSFGFFVKPMELIGGNQIAQAQLMQMFPWFGTLKSAKNEASTMALSSFELFRAEKEDIFLNVKKTYYQLFFIQKQLQVYDTALILLNSIKQLQLIKIGTTNTATSNPVNTSMPSTSGSTKNANGMSTMNAGSKQSLNQPAMSSQPMGGSSSAFADMLRIQIEIKELEDNIAFLQNQKQSLIIQLNSLLNRNSETVIAIPNELNAPVFDYYNTALFDSIKVNNPMIRMNKADILAYQQRQTMNKRMSYPMIGLGLNYMLINKNSMSTSPMNGEDMIMPMLTVKVPLYRKKYNASIKEAELLESSSTEQLQSAENMLFVDYSDNIFSLKNAERKYAVYTDIISLTIKSFDLQLVQYATSSSEFESLIRLHRQILEYKLTILQAKVDKLTAIAGIEKLLSKN